MTDRSIRLILFVHVFLFALVVGVFWGTWFMPAFLVSAGPVLFGLYRCIGGLNESRSHAAQQRQRSS